MYGKKRIGTTRTGVAFIAGEGSHQNVGRIINAVPTASNPQGKGYDVFFCNWKYIGTTSTKIKAKILMFNAAKNHKDYCSSEA